MLIERDLIRVNSETLEKYLGLYANDDSINLSQLQYDALDKLFELGYKHGFYEQLICAKDFLIPNEYAQLRSN